jgi:YfiR/HmsC-like
MPRNLQPAEKVCYRNPWMPLGLCSAILLASCLGCPAQSSLAPSDVEAAYLYNFGKFVDWPPQPDPAQGPFTICIVGKDDFGRTLDSLVAHEALQGRSIVAKRLPTIASADACQIVYIGLSEQSRMSKDLEALKDKPVLTVSSLPGFLDHGGIIQFVLEQNRVRFAVNLTAAAQTHLTLSAELVKVALYVNSKPAQEGQP